MPKNNNKQKNANKAPQPNFEIRRHNNLAALLNEEDEDIDALARANVDIVNNEEIAPQNEQPENNNLEILEENILQTHNREAEDVQEIAPQNAEPPAQAEAQRRPAHLRALYEEDDDDDIDPFDPDKDIFKKKPEVEIKAPQQNNLDALRREILANNGIDEEEAKEEVKAEAQPGKKNFFEEGFEDDPEPQVVNNNRRKAPLNNAPAENRAEKMAQMRNQLQDIFGADEDEPQERPQEEAEIPNELAGHFGMEDEPAANQNPNVAIPAHLQTFIDDIAERPEEPKEEAEPEAEAQAEAQRQPSPLRALYEEDDGDIDPFDPNIDIFKKKPEVEIKAEPAAVNNNLELLRRNMMLAYGNDPDEIYELEEEIDPAKNVAEVHEEPFVETVLSPEDERANAEMFKRQLEAHNKMYKTNIDADALAGNVADAWDLIVNGDEAQKLHGRRVLRGVFNTMLKQAFEEEKKASYEEERMPEYAEIIKSSNELLRVTMFAFTDMYTNPRRAELFEMTAYGGMNAEKMAALTSEQGVWKGDQRSDEAWERQSMKAVNLSIKWSGSDEPRERMKREMYNLSSENKKGTLDKKDAYNKLAAAELMLMSDDKLMVIDPKDPDNRVPDWSNEYWKVLCQTRENLGIPKHISMRELIQGNYAEIQKTACNAAYNKKQFVKELTSKKAHAQIDSIEKQKEEFTIRREGIVMNDPANEARFDNLEMTSTRMQISVKECDEKELMKSAPKSGRLEIQRTAEHELNVTA